MTVKEFVLSIWENDRNGSDDLLMDLETAKEDLRNFDNIPDGITPEAYMEAWNEIVRENR